MTAHIILTRHGESTVNVIQLASDDHENNPLTALGVAQAEQLAEALLGSEVAHVYTSPTQRARETGEIVAGALGVPTSLEWGLEEIRVGVHEGERGEAALARGTIDFRRWLADGDLDHGYPGGENGHQVAHRASAALRRIADRHQGDSVLVVSHGGTLTITLPTLCDNLTHQALYHRQLHNCGRVAVEVDVEGQTWTCLHWMGVDPEELSDESVA